jgi:hypothetical protein
MSPVPPHLIEDDDGPSPLNEEGLNPFGGGAAFGEGSFGPHEEEEVDDPSVLQPGQTILQRHKVDVALSRRRWNEYRAEWRRERDDAERRRKRKRKAELDGLGQARREAVAYASEVAAAVQPQPLGALPDLRPLTALPSLHLVAQIREQMYRQAVLAAQQEEEEMLELLLLVA